LRQKSSTFLFDIDRIFVEIIFVEFNEFFFYLPSRSFRSSRFFSNFVQGLFLIVCGHVVFVEFVKSFKFDLKKFVGSKICLQNIKRLNHNS